MEILTNTERNIQAIQVLIDDLLNTVEDYKRSKRGDDHSLRTISKKGQAYESITRLIKAKEELEFRLFENYSSHFIKVANYIIRKGGTVDRHTLLMSRCIPGGAAKMDMALDLLEREGCLKTSFRPEKSKIEYTIIEHEPETMDMDN